MREIICKNSKGKFATITYGEPYWLEEVEGIGLPEYTNFMTKGSEQDGESYNGSNADKRNISFKIRVISESVLKETKALLSVFVPKQTGELLYRREDDVSRIEYVVKSVDVADDGYTKIVSVELECPSPFFQDVEESKLEMASLKGLIRFPIKLPRTPFKMTEKIRNIISNAYNDCNIDLGMRIEFYATGSCATPSIFNIENRDFLKIDTVMQAGDKITVTTGYRNKKIELVRNGVITDITNRFLYGSKWLKVYDGDNSFQYDALSGSVNLNVIIFYRKLRLWVV